MNQRAKTRDGTASQKATTFPFRGTPKFWNGTKAMSASTSRTTFFQKVCACVRWMASPKQPQSMTGFAIQRMRVTMVKKTTMTEATTAVNFRYTPVMSAAPVMLSSRARPMPKGFDNPCRNPTWKNLKYSLTMRPVPTGSSSLKRPENRKVRPMRTAHRRRSL